MASKSKKGPKKKSPKNRIPKETSEILSGLSIDENEPGSVLRDFETLLAYIRENAPVSVSKKLGYLPQKMLPEINDRLAKPLKIGFKSPKMNSYPNIAGLYLLLRASGLAYVESGKTQKTLVLDDSPLNVWNTLNPVERYFSLLETLILRAHPGILGEDGWIFGHVLNDWKTFFKYFPENEINFSPVRGYTDFMSRHPEVYLLALMEMFGFIRIEEDDCETGKGWNIKRIEKTSVGEAVLQALESAMNDDLTMLLVSFSFDGPDFEESHGKLLPVFQPFFKDLEKRLPAPEYEIREGVYIFKVSIGRSWRRIAISGEAGLDRLSGAILNAFHFDFDHLYAFYVADRFGVNRAYYHPSASDGPFADETRVRELALGPGDEMTFLYDFGDNWRFKVLLERVDSPDDPSLKEPKLLESRGEAPKQYGW